MAFFEVIITASDPHMQCMHHSTHTNTHTHTHMYLCTYIFINICCNIIYIHDAYMVISIDNVWKEVYGCLQTLVL